MRTAIALMTLLATVTACGGSDSGSSGTAAGTSVAPATTAPPATTPPTTAATTVPPTTVPPTTVPPTTLPPPTLSAGAAVTLPDGFLPAESAEAGGVRVVAGSAGPLTGVSTVVVATQAADGAITTATLDPGGYSPSGGMSLPYGWTARSVAAGPAGYVVAATAGLYSGNYNRGLASLLWFSPDGTTWTPIDPRPVVQGAVDGWLSILYVRATSAGFVALGSNGLQQSIVLTSADGVQWEQRDASPVQWSLVPSGLWTDGDVVLAEVAEYECLTDPFAAGSQPLWRLSGDGGLTWAPVDMSVVPGLSNYVAEPDAASCALPEYTGYDNLAKLAGRHGPVGVVGGQVVVLDPDLGTVASSADGATWTTAVVPDVPTPGTGYLEAGSRPSIVTAVGGTAVVLVQQAGDFGATPPPLAAWVSRDGATWTAIDGPALLPDGTILLLDPSASGATAITYTVDSTGALTSAAAMTPLTIG